MSWVFASQDAAGQDTSTYEARMGSRMQLIASPDSTGISVLPTPPHDESSVLGIADIETWGVKLRAVGAPLMVLPGFPTKEPKTDTPSEAYTLQPETEGKLEVVLLRAHDRIFSARTPGQLVLTWKAPQVQVDSSVTAEGEVPDSVDLPIQGNTSDPAQKTEDEDDLDRTVQNAIQPSVRSTPFPASRTETIVQETPNVGRIQTELELPSISSPSPINEITMETPPEGASEVDALLDTILPKELPEEAEVYSTTPVKRQAFVKVPAKRRSPASVDENQENSARSNKRGKISVENGPEGMIPILYTASKTATKIKKRTSNEHQEELASKPLRSSQRSAKDDDKYDGPPPRVLFSNSAIPESAKEVMRFLKKHGVSVDSVDDGCNILCVKPGTLSKTMKLLQAIALGIPIVTDIWLLSSAKAGHFLPLDNFKPAAPTQEKEWNFSLARIWGKPQNTLFSGCTIAFTPKLKASYSNYREIEHVCKSVGARRVVSKKAAGKYVDGSDTIVLAAEYDDEVADALLARGDKCFTKDFLTNSILRGEVDLQSNEFRITGSKPKTGKKKGRPKKG